MLPFVVSEIFQARFTDGVILLTDLQRTMASNVFAVIVLNSELPGSKTIALTAVCTILLSVIAHGLSANPFVNALAKKSRLHPLNKI